jgi:mono/diheme cytochrome c family protein
MSKSLYALLFAGLTFVAAPAGAAGEARTTSFVRDVAPILVRKCQACHGPKTAESNYRLDSFELLMQPGDFGTPTVAAGNLEESEIHRLITSEDPDERMPNNGDRLADAEIAVISNWIREGAAFDGQDPKAPLREQIPRDLPHPAAPTVYPAKFPITAMAFAPGGSQLVVGGYHELLLWDPLAGALTARLGNMPQRVMGLAFSPDHSKLTVAGGAAGVAGEVRLVSWSAGAPAGEPKVLATLDDVFFDVAFRPDGARLAASGSDGSVRVFDVAAGTELSKISNHADWVVDVCYSPDGTRLATASRDKTAKVFEADTGRLLGTLPVGTLRRRCARPPRACGGTSAGGRRARAAAARRRRAPPRRARRDAGRPPARAAGPCPIAPTRSSPRAGEVGIRL